ncbi:DUF7674 family protein [Candidatus Neptunichlamydia sp. REUL1]|uniref:DUF7674 family protein n=1 Tax=Candidatus Neptunichlamydia sp. REUL1 TaxID=3064277 RepID=UPI002931D09B|nr:hypothetical protein [Candidatus Neptunochlamydia sp. REUL1]
MEEITEKKCIELTKKRFPKFLPYWSSYIRDFGPDLGITIQMIPLEEYTVDTIKAHSEREIKEIFDFVEFLLTKGNQSVQTAITTSYLESLMILDPDEIKFRWFVKFLGPHTLEYCRAWDKFTGVRTDGLWDEEVI